MPVNPTERSTGITGIQNFRNRMLVVKGGYIDYANFRYEDDFEGDLLKDSWAVTVDGAGTAAIPSASGNQLANGAVLLTTAATNDNKVELAQGQNILTSLAPIFETRVYLSSAAEVAAVVGLSDSPSEAASTTAYSSNAGRVAVATNGVYIGFDTDDATYTKWTALAVKAGVAATPVNLGVTPVAATYNILRIELDTSGNANFFIDASGNGEFTYRGTIKTCVTTTTLLCPYLAVQSRVAAGGAKVLTADYVRVYQKRS